MNPLAPPKHLLPALAVLLLLAPLSGAVPLPDEVPGAVTDTPRQGVLYQMKIVDKTRCTPYSYLMAPPCPLDKAVDMENVSLMQKDASLYRNFWQLQPATVSPGEPAPLGAATELALRSYGRNYCSAYLAASSACATTTLPFVDLAKNSRFAVVRVPGSQTQFTVVAKNRASCASGAKNLGGLNHCKPAPGMYAPPPAGATGVLPLVAWEFENVCMDQGTPCVAPQPAGKIACCPGAKCVKRTPAASAPTVCARVPKPVPTGAVTLAVLFPTKISASVAKAASNGGSAVDVKFQVQITELGATGTPRGPYTVTGTGLGPTIQLFEEGKKGVPAGGLCAGTWEPRVRFANAVGWGPWSTDYGPISVTTGSCTTQCGQVGDLCTGVVQGTCCDASNVCSNFADLGQQSYCAVPPSGPAITLEWKDSVSLSGTMSITDSGVGAVTPVITYDWKVWNSFQGVDTPVIESQERVDSLSVPYEPQFPGGVCPGNGVRRILYSTVDVTNGIGAPVSATSAPLVCPCLQSGRECWGTEDECLIDMEGAGPMCCPAGQLQRKLVVNQDGTYCNCLPGGLLSPDPAVAENCCALATEPDDTCSCIADGGLPTVYGKLSCCSPRLVPDANENDEYCNCLPDGVPTFDDQDCCTGQAYNDNGDYLCGSAGAK